MIFLKGLKITVLGFFLLTIFSLPALTATQLVTVLSATTSKTGINVKFTGDTNTFIKEQGHSYTVSFLNAGYHQLLQVSNPTPTSRTIQVQLGNLKSETLPTEIILLSGNNKFTLFKNSPNPIRAQYLLTIPAGITNSLEINVLSPDSKIFGTFDLSLTEI